MKKFKRLDIIFDNTIKITETEYIRMKHEIETLRELTATQALELQEYKTFFENMQKLLDKQ